MFGYAKVFVNLPGEGSGKKVEDLLGRKWDCIEHATFIFDVVRDDTGVRGLRFKSMKHFGDPTPIFGEAIRRSVLSSDNLTA